MSNETGGYFGSDSAVEQPWGMKHKGLKMVTVSNLRDPCNGCFYHELDGCEYLDDCSTPDGEYIFVEE
jgi:hypothetical protein